MRHVVLTRSAYGPAWSREANLRRFEMTRAVTVRSMRSQTSQGFEWIVLLHAHDPLRAERERLYAGAQFIYTEIDAPPIQAAAQAYRGWDSAIGPRNGWVAMTRLDDDDGFAPWAMATVERKAVECTRRTALLFPLGIRVWQGRYTLVRHDSNAMHTLVTPPGDTLGVYDYLHRRVRHVAAVRSIDRRPAWVWSRHPDTISGWRFAERVLTPEIRAMFDVDWSIFGEPQERERPAVAGRRFR